MRVTDASMYANAARAHQSARQREQQAMNQAASGLALVQPWDAPGAGRVARERYARDRADAIEGAASMALGEADAVDRALSDMTEVVGDAAALAVRMANDSFSATDRARGAHEARQLLQRFVSSANVEVAGRFVLAGSNDQVAPFAADGTFSGDAAVRQQEVAPGLVAQVSVSGAALTAAGGVDVAAQIAALAQALDANDAAAIGAAIDGLRSGVDQVAALHAEVGGIALGLQTAGVIMRQQGDDAARRKAEITDVDFADAALALAQADRALEAAFASSAKGLRLSLLDHLR